MPNWKTIKDFLGVGPGYYSDDYDAYEEYEDYDDQESFNDDGNPGVTVHDRPAVRAVPSPSSGHRPRVSGRAGSDSPRQAEDWEEGDGGVRVIGGPSEPDEPRGIVRPVPTSAKPYVVSPDGFDDVQQVADRFRGNQPVIMNMQGIDAGLRRRLIDFASGVCYGLNGQMERIAQEVFLLTPAGAEVSDDDRRKLRDGDLQD